MTTLELFAASAFVFALHRLAPVNSAAFWMVAVPAMICMGLAGWGGYQQGRRSLPPTVPGNYADGGRL